MDKIGQQLIVVALLLIGSSALAGPTNALKKGHIKNEDGEKCEYTQEIKEKNKHFHGDFPGENGVITFDDPACMGEGVLGLDINKMMINNILAKWYSHDDADFQTKAEDLYSGSLMQKVGQCIQSGTYPDIGITVDYLVEEKAITGVVHGSSIQGCTNEE